MHSKFLARLLFGGVLLVAASAVSPVRSAEKDIFDYKAYHAAPEGTKRIVFIAATGSHGLAGNHEFLAGSIYFARTINADFPNAYAVVYPQNHWPTDLSKADAIIVLLNHAGQAAIRSAHQSRGRTRGRIHGDPLRRRSESAASRARTISIGWGAISRRSGR